MEIEAIYLFAILVNTLLTVQSNTMPTVQWRDLKCVCAKCSHLPIINRVT